jgi:beta-lactamase class A
VVELVDDLRAALTRFPGTFAIYARNLSTGAVVDLDADRVLPTESAAKTFVLITYCQLVERGECDPEARLAVPEGFRLHGTGVLRYLRAGLNPTIEDLVWLMTIVSDNVATALLLLELGGPDRINDVMTNLGLDTARLSSFDEMAAGNGFATSSPRDLAEAYTHLDGRALEMLLHQQDQIGLSRQLHYHPLAADHGLPLPTRLYNKTGTGPGTFVDAGRFETATARWVIAAMATDQDGFTSCPDDDAPIAIGQVGRLVHDAWAAG